MTRRTDHTSFHLFTPEEKDFLERMFADHPGMAERFETFLALLPETRYVQAMGDLRQTPRTGWVKRGVKNPESVMDHIGDLVVMAGEFALPEDCSGISARNRLIRMAMLHDIPEAIVSDFTPNCPILPADKDQLESLATRVIFQQNAYARHLIIEYIEQKTALSHTLHDMDKLSAVFKALQYEGMYPEKRGQLFEDFLNSAKPRLKTDEGRRFVDDIERDAEAIRRTARQHFLEEKFAGRTDY